MNAPTRPIHLPGESAYEWLRQRAIAALDAWARDWVSGWKENDPRLASLQICAASDAAGLQSHEYGAVGDPEARLWIRGSDADRLNCGRAVVGAELMPHSACADDWIEGVTDHAWSIRNRALCAELLDAPQPEICAPTSALPADLLAFGSGAVHLSCGALGLHAIAERAVWRSLPASAREPVQPLPKLTPLDRAAHGALVALEVMLGSVEIDLPKLMDLRHGDVLRLPQRLDQGLAVSCAGRPLARAVLGESQGRKCVQIIANHQ